MTFIKGQLCELRALDPDDEMQVGSFTEAVNAGLTTKHLFTGSIPMRTKDYAAKWVQELKAGEILFGIWSTAKADGGNPQGPFFIGTCGLHSHKDIYKSWEFRILIFDPAFLGKGIGTEATRLTTDYAFYRLNAHRVWLGVNAQNTGAVKCYEKVGYKLEGVLRDEIFCYGHYCDALRYAILEDEWKSLSSDQAR